MRQRRAHRTTDPELLAQHLATNIGEISDYAGTIAHADPERVLNGLERIRSQLQNMIGECREHIDAIHDARRFGGLPEWDVLEQSERTPTSEETRS